MTFSDTLTLSWRTVRSNKLRTGITVSIIAFGIMALIGIITAIEAMNQSLYENFSILGANSFSIRFKERNIRFGGGPKSDLKKVKFDLIVNEADFLAKKENYIKQKINRAENARYF